MAPTELHISASIFLFFMMSLCITDCNDKVDHGTCGDGCNASSFDPAPPGMTDDLAILETSTPATIESTEEATTSNSEGASSTATTTTTPDATITTVRDSSDLGIVMPHKHLPSTVPISSTEAIPLLTKGVKSLNRTSPYGDHCPCDLMVGSCDPNCCCDVLDCTEVEKEAFSACLPLPSAVPDPRQCNQYKWITTPNRTLELELTDSQHGLLCIDRDNNPGRLALANQEPARSLKDFRALIGKKVSFQWPAALPYEHHFDANSSYKAGDIMWMVQDSTLKPLEFMTSGFNNICQSKRAVRFLSDWVASCLMPLPFMDEDDKRPRSSTHHTFREKCSEFSAILSFKEAMILRSPLHWLNVTSMVCPPESCINAQQWVCQSENFDDCAEVEVIPKAVLIGETCANALLAFRLVMDVVGVNLHSAQAYSVISNVSFSGKSPSISQRHSVVFKWWSSEEDIGSENDKDRMVWRRSGNPGYIVGAPVMAGWKETVVLGGEDVKQREDGVEGGVLEGMRVTPLPEGWLTVLGPKAGTGTCGGSRRAVRFGHSARWSCSIPVVSSDFMGDGCLALKRKTLALLLGWGSMGNLSERFVAMFGDSSPERVDEWIPLKIFSHNGKELSELTEEKWEFLGNAKRKSCPGLHTSVHLEIATALVGSVNNPQAKLLGAILRLGPTVDIEAHELWPRGVEQGGGGDVAAASGSANGTPSNMEAVEMATERRKHLILVTSVQFTDVTGPPVMEVAPPPVYHIRLPYGFFHPFLSHAPCPSSRESYSLLVVLITLVLVHSKICFDSVQP